MIDLLGGALPREACSRAGCTADASWRIDWRNPRIHTGDRFKTWLACDEHVDYLRDFLAAREFPLTVKPVDSLQPGEAAS
ncbi:hypothetical protein [Microterricola viridarii]|uniref:Acetone carboxylase n=1 Tax=Microterricola viridarii TaxID=412690 RepID=A0A1H1UJ14_9MICO|nr:hypothetical protein [Microterricola viridarii]SDS72482.1 hypothetical protein SAMN04489834_2021 [Microterricola viridarii]